jgi:hypothetical protein
VRIGKRREPSYAELAELLDALLVRAAVADGPLAADLRSGLVELRVDLGLDVGRQEVDVHVEETGNAEVAPPLGDPGRVVCRIVRRVVL